MPEIVVATANEHKLQEIKQILAGIPAVILSLKDFPHIGPIEETGSTFEENAKLKAETVFRETGLIALGDDSGLEVDALNGAPGIFSARYAGPEHDYLANNLKLLKALKNVPELQRTARFRCSVSIVTPEQSYLVEGIVNGKIINEMCGVHGFGYDPLFVPDGYSLTFAEMGESEKNRISHRALAFTKAKEILLKILN